MHGMPGSQLDEVVYHSRAVWAAIKRATALSRRGDATFYVERFSRALRSGRIGDNFAILSLGNDDGAGAQAQASMSALCFARAHDLTYIHRPFTTVAFPETDMPSWVRMWEEYFNIGEGEQQLGHDQLPQIMLDRLPLQRRRTPMIVAANHYLHYCNRDGDAWERVLPELRAKFWRHKQRRVRSRAIRLAVHMRRGDVAADSKYANNFTPNGVFVNALTRLKRIVEPRAPLDIEIHSQGEPQMFADLTQLGAKLCLDLPAMETHRALVEADILIMSKGAYSYTAGVLNEGIALYDPQKYRPLQGWIARAPDGSFDEAAVARRLEAMLRERSRAA